MQSQNLYFLAIVPHGKVAGEVTAFKEHIAQHYNSQKALKVMPHITLKAPFKTDATRHAEVTAWFRQLEVSVQPFIQHLNGFGAFNNKNNPVLYVQPVLNNGLAQLQYEIISQFEMAFAGIPLQFTEKRFSPHITIAYRDLLPEQFSISWDEFKGKPYDAQFEVNAFYLLQHNGIKWNIIAEKILK